MNGHDFTLAGETLTARGDGALWWAGQRILAVSDLHLGKAERIARRGGTMLPPYETTDTLGRLEAAIRAADPAIVVCLGDSFDDRAAAEALPEEARLWLARLQAGRRWIWIEGNHDPGPLDFGGSHLESYSVGSLTFRHIAQPGAAGEISGHYHPKITLALGGRSVSRPCFVYDRARLILPAFGTYTGGLRVGSPELDRLVGEGGCAVLTGPTPHAVPLRRAMVSG